MDCYLITFDQGLVTRACICVYLGVILRMSVSWCVCRCVCKCTTSNLSGMKCPSVLVFYAKYVCVVFFVCVCVRAVLGAMEAEQLLFILTEWTPMCQASTMCSLFLWPTQVCVCVCVFV